jgi:UrcA family protein
MKKSKLFKSLLTSIIVITLSAPAIGLADAKSELKGKSVKVTFADLDLTKQEGAKALYRRLQQASKQACDVRGLKVEGTLKRISEARQCYREALTGAVEKVDSKLVTQIHDS